MKLSQENRDLYHVFSLPSVFVTEKMHRLDVRSLKLYLYLAHLASERRTQLKEEELAAFLDMNGMELADALSVLAKEGLVVLKQSGLELTDLAAAAAAERAAAEERAAAKRKTDPETQTRREKVISQINETFFHGCMQTYFYREIDRWFDEYHFEPEVVYALFQEVSEHGKLRGTSYASAIAANWANHGVRNYKQLSRYFESYHALRGTAELVRKKMKMRHELNEYQLETIDRWVNRWKMSNELIDEALRRASRTANPSFSYAEKILEDWHKAGLKDLEAVKSFEASSRPKPAGRARTAKSKSPAGNFDQRVYDPEDIEALYATLDLAGTETATGESQDGEAEN